MKVVDLHPEDLIDRLSAGSLSPAERERLDAHLSQCDACRFELSVRDDFEQDAPVVEERPQLTFSSPSATERTRPPAPMPRAARVTPSMRARSRRRWPLALLAAALLLCAGGATAAVVTGAVQAPWLPWTAEPKARPSEPRAATVAKAAPKSKHVAAKLAASSAPSSAPVDEPAVAADVPSATPPAQVPAAPAPLTATSGVTSEPRVAAVQRAPAPRALALPSNAAFAPLAGASDSTASNAGAERASPKVDPAAALFADANRARRDGNAERAVTLYRALQSGYPSSSESELSRALLAQLLLDRGSPEAALAGFDRYLAQGAPVLSAEALVGRARALEQLGKPAQAAAAWREVQNRFAGSVHARLAATRLAALGTR